MDLKSIFKVLVRETLTITFHKQRGIEQPRLRSVKEDSKPKS